MAARLVCGFLRRADSYALSFVASSFLQEARPDTLGDLEPIRELPVLQLALARTLSKAWRAGLDVGARKTEHSRIAPHVGIERAVLGRLPLRTQHHADGGPGTLSAGTTSSSLGFSIMALV